MESLAYIELATVNEEGKQLKLIEGLNWKKLSSLAYINFLSITIINFLIINVSLAMDSDKANNYFASSQTDHSQVNQAQLIARNSFSSGDKPDSDAILSPSSSVYLRRGDSAPTVAALQRKLRELGYFTANITSYYGPITERAVREYQQDNGIPPTGKVEPTTWSLLFGGRKYAGGDRFLHSYPRRILSFGEVSPEVAILQKRLKELGFYRGPINSIYDQATRTAVINFQEAYRITPTGQVGITTWNFLFDSKTVAIERVFLQRGDVGPQVRRLQERLKSLRYYQGPINSYFDHSTEEAVISFQKRNRITPTGQVGPTTQAFLFDGNQVLPPGPVSDFKTSNVRQNSYIDVLRRGNRGQDVKQLQILLTRLGYYPGFIDGYFGPATEFAVKCLQQDLGLPASGVATRTTLQALKHPIVVPENTYAYDHKPNYRRSQTEVLKLQNRLRSQGLYYGPLNGVYNSETRAAVAKAQLRYGITSRDITFGR
ncbi:MAG: peptidoglycan-binding protein [Microcoleaceae cyanobacterium MO_207.B10]|nr:peptidoglycan-binding protein [Microcoleaceae cyanobacterium MO_207.B10]